MRDLILLEIKRLAEAAGGKPPGVKAFASATGITEGRWRGVVWARWGDALIEAGYRPNELQSQLPEDEVLLPVAILTRRLGRLPTRAEIKLESNRVIGMCSPGAITRRYPTKDALIVALRALCMQEDYSDLAAILPLTDQVSAERPDASPDGSVYLLRSGNHYKIGKSSDLERRIKEIRVALPEATILVHSIRTDDPSGIEAYWHRRFANIRANGEWFALSPKDIKAFCRRTFQ